MPRGSDASTALVLSGGGARGAYQVGVLRSLLDLDILAADEPGFHHLVGSSAGALNAGALATEADRLGRGVEVLESIWTNIEPEHVFRTDLGSLGGIGFQWVRDLSFGGFVQSNAPKYLLDTAPLGKLLESRVDCGRIGTQVASGALRALAIMATNLYTADGIVFLDAAENVPLWRRGRWSVERTSIGPAHLLASSAIPVFFPSVQIEGRHFGDGSIRNTAPLSPAIQLGADHIFAIGVRSPELATESAGVRHESPPTVAQVAGTLLDAVMLDALEVDVEHSQRVNSSVVRQPVLDEAGDFRWVDILHVSPNYAFGQVAAQFSHRIPRALRYLLRGLGDDESTMELVSYLLFDGEYCRRLIEIGAQDVVEHEDDLRAFFAREHAPPH